MHVQTCEIPGVVLLEPRVFSDPRGFFLESFQKARYQAAGIPDEVYFGALEKNAGYSGLTQLKTAKLRQGDWSPQFSVKHMLKDMRLALGAGSEAALPLTQAVEHCLEQARINGWGDLDFSALFRNLA